MARPRTAKVISITGVRGTLDGLFDDPPTSRAAMKRRLQGLDKTALRAALMERLRSGLTSLADSSLVIDALGAIGLTNSERAMLENLALDRSAGVLSRVAASWLLTQDDLGWAERAATQRGQEAAETIADLPLYQLLVFSDGEDELALHIANLLVAAPDDLMRTMLVERLGECRRHVGMTAAATYGRCLQAPELANVHELMIDAIATEGSPVAITTLKEGRDCVTSANRRRIDAALMRLRTRAIAPTTRTTSASPGRAYVFPCRHDGALTIIAAIAHPIGTERLAYATFWADEGGFTLSDGFVLPHHRAGEAEVLRDEMLADHACPPVAMSLEDAAAVIGPILDGLADGAEDQAALVQTCDTWRHIARTPLALPALTATEAPKPAEARAFLSRPEHADWRLPVDDVAAWGGGDPPRSARKAWQASTRAYQLDFLCTMIDAMVRLYTLCGDLATARLGAALMADLETRGVESAIVQVLAPRPEVRPKAPRAAAGARGKAT